jgi:hypothetical protein
MNDTLRQILESTALLLLLLAGKYVSPPLGGVFVGVTSLTKTIPIVGRLFAWLLFEPLRFHVVAKLIGWLLSSIGPLLGLAIHFFIWGELNHPSEFWILVFVAIATISDIVYGFFTFETVYIDRLMNEIGSWTIGHGKTLREMFLGATPSQRRRIARTNFVDMHLTDFFTLLVSLGIVYYCIGELRLVTVKGEPFSLGQALLFSFSLNDLIDVGLTQAMPYEGIIWFAIHIFASFIIFFWLVFFITITSSGIDESVTIWEEKNLPNLLVSLSGVTVTQENVSLKNNDVKTQIESSSKEKTQEPSPQKVNDEKEKTPT